MYRVQCEFFIANDWKNAAIFRLIHYFIIICSSQKSENGETPVETEWIAGSELPHFDRLQNSAVMLIPHTVVNLWYAAINIK